ncbi:Uncharacterised protein [Shigella sonnei]|nr:Uncharacterised protein [Shigella sonnei]
MTLLIYPLLGCIPLQAFFFTIIPVTRPCFIVNEIIILAQIPDVVCFLKRSLCLNQHLLRGIRTTNIQHRIPHGFECTCSPVCPGLQRAHVLFQAAGLVIKPFRCGLVRRLQCPGFIAGTLQLSNIRNLLRRHVMELACHRRQPRRRVCGQLPEGFSDLVHLHAGCRGETRHTLADGRNLSLTAYPRLNQCAE